MLTTPAPSGWNHTGCRVPVVITGTRLVFQAPIAPTVVDACRLTA